MAEQEMPGLARVAFFDGQRLTAADLTDVQARDRELRWLHNRSLHAWGVALGLGVTGATGDREVTVAPGYGTDCLGREIVLAERRVVPVPPVAGTTDPDGPGDTYYLVAVYAEDHEAEVDEQRAGACAAGGAVRRREAPLLQWRTSVSGSSPELVLAQVWVRNCKLSRPVSLEVRRLARPSDQPYLASGTTPEKGNWQPFVGAGQTGVLLRVDTSAARFGSTPRYVAHLVGERVFAETYVDGIGRVTEPTASDFVFRVVLLATAMGQHLDDIEAAWRVTWLGVEA